ncbi:MAG: C39 family peptidase [Dongiaceae bacterium]
MKRLIALLVSAAFLLAPVVAKADQPIALPGKTSIRAPVTSYVALRFKDIVKQGYDVSCGAAALATLLTYYYGVKVSEKEVIDGIMATSDDNEKKQINGLGFSMLELKHYGESRGFAAGGFRIDDVNKLAKLKVPALTLITIRGYSHFVVLKGIDRGQVFIADPAFGNRSRPIDRFAEEWGGVILVMVNTNTPPNKEFSPEGSLKGRAQDVIPLIDRFGSPYTPTTGEF